VIELPKIKKRVNQINDFNYDELPALAKTRIRFEDDRLIYEQELLDRIKHQKPKLESLVNLVHALGYLEKIGFVHGDINRKNIINTGTELKIVDFEPSPTQVRNGVKQLLITRPYASKIEIDDANLTPLTDKIGFIYFLLRIQNKITSKHIVELSKTFDHKGFLGKSEKWINSTSYEELLAYFYIDC
tara:strand:+ start:4833 stop:5393 length:561 start_codon:yes stop_codon:yes gene_type:complete